MQKTEQYLKISGEFMSGHSKWSTIKRKKDKIDQARGKVFTKLIKEITVASRLGGSNVDTNSRLKVAIERAKAANMPADSIERARLKGAGELPGVVYEEIVYEGYGAAGVAVVVETNTDNKQRTVSEVRHAFDRNGGNLGSNGSVSFMFHKKGQIIIEAEGVNEDELMDDALEAGAEDVTNEGDAFVIYTEFQDYFAVCTELEKKYTLADTEITMIPDNYVTPPADKETMVRNLIDKLEDLDDVEAVYSNAKFADELED